MDPIFPKNRTGGAQGLTHWVISVSLPHCLIHGYEWSESKWLMRIWCAMWVGGLWAWKLGTSANSEPMCDVQHRSFTQFHYMRSWGPQKKEMNIWIKLLFICIFFYSRRLINLRLSHCSHSDYFNNVFHNFWAGQFRSLKKPMEEWSSKQI